MLDYTLSIAPMMGYTDRHYRYLARLIHPTILLYTEMVTTGAILNGRWEAFLKYDVSEHPVALQLGGCDPLALEKCARLGEQLNYDEINLNVGCPSARVKAGQFGACLMQEPQLVADCMQAMIEAVKIPVTIKTRIGVDEADSYAELCHLIETVARTGCNVFIMHARKAWLNGLSPEENRTIPPLRYDVVHQLKRDFPLLKFILNGGLQTTTAVLEQLTHVHGVMLGRAAYANPDLLRELAQHLMPTQPLLSIPEIIERYATYMQQELLAGARPTFLLRHLSAFYRGQAGAGEWRRGLGKAAAANNPIEALVRLVKEQQGRMGQVD